MHRALDASGPWPALPFEEWRDTYATLHMWTQVIGKIRLALAPMTNQWWQVPLYVSARGLTTSPIPYGARSFEIDFDFIDHNLVVRTSEGATRALALVPRTVADFFRETRAILLALDLAVRIRTLPAEVPSPIPFPDDTRHAAYDAEHAHRFWDICRRIDLVLKEFRAGFRGKSSPVQFYWGTFDLAVTRFSGRMAPERPGADRITRLSYDEEQSSVGFWPGDATTGGPAFYAYTAPEPKGIAERKILPAAAFWSREKKEFLLPYEEVRREANPARAILAFAETTYEAGAALAGWDRAALAYPPGARGAAGARAHAPPERRMRQG
jgi:hypothetical protein